MMTDPIADMITRVRNANRNAQKSVSMPASQLKVNIAEVLKAEGFIDGFTVEAGTPRSTLVIQMRYGIDGEKVIRSIERVSKPGRRIYTPNDRLPTVLHGMGMFVLSTSEGILSDRHARERKVGGEVLIKIS